MEEYIQAAEDDMKSALDALQRDLGKVRTGRATPKLLEPVVVEVHSYGATLPITQLATVTAPDARLIVVTPWDKTTMGDIERAILSAGLGLNPSSDGTLIRVPVPPLTADRRKDLVKQVKSLGEDSKVRVRAVRREYNDIFKQGEDDGDISEDDLTRFLDRVQKLTDRYCELVDKAVDAKEKEVIEV